MEFAEISIKDRPLFEKYLRVYQPRISEMTFSNLFMWREYYGFRYAEICGMLCIVSVGQRNQPFAFAPIGEYEEASVSRVVEILGGYFKDRGWQLRFERTSEDALQHLRRYVSSGDNIILSRANSDYVYLKSDLEDLKGKKYDGKRNHINKFKKTYNYEYVGFDTATVSDIHLKECSRILDEWIESRSDEPSDESLVYEKKANMELINNFSEMACAGALVKADGKFEAFTIGEMLNDDTAVIHAEKANSHINGLYTFINQQFCKNQWKDVKFINREQDLGLAGLRKAKLSYNPAFMIDKYILIME